MNLSSFLQYPTVAFVLAMWTILPSEAWVRRLAQHRKIQLWTYETAVVGLLLGMVVLLAGGGPTERVGWAALMLAHGRNSIMLRAVEAQSHIGSGAAGHVECARWTDWYLYGAEVAWWVYFWDHKAWAAMCGVAVFLGYARWRRYVTRKV